MDATNTGEAEVRKILERKQSELIQELRERDGIVIEKNADQMDEVQSAGERELAIRNADRESKQLREVKAALRRLDDGSYGVCVECEWTINANRLAAVPWASRCIVCQETADQNGAKQSDSLDESLADAA